MVAGREQGSLVAGGRWEASVDLVRDQGGDDPKRMSKRKSAGWSEVQAEVL